MNIQRDVSIQAEAAKVLVENMKDVFGEDDALLHDAIEGETDLIEAITNAVLRVQDIKAFTAGTDDQIKTLQARKARLKTQADTLRAAILSAMAMADLKTLEIPTATLSRKKAAQTLIVTEEADIPSEYFKPQPPKLDRKAVLDALKDKDNVPGATLSNGGETLGIRGQ